MKRIFRKHWYKLVFLLVLAICFLVFSVALGSRSYKNKSEKKEPQIVYNMLDAPFLFSVTPPKRITEEVSTSSIITEEEIINNYIKDICTCYNIEPELIESMVYHESRYNTNASNGNCVGLMQVSTRWHAARADKLGITDFYDPYSNILLGVDYISELIKSCNDTSLALMIYNMGWNSAVKMHNEGKESSYARSVLSRAKDLKEIK